ncbi:putative quinol monooxygenase [Streptococcus dentiloxodontae]
MTVGCYTLCHVDPSKTSEFEAVARKFVTESHTHQGCLHYDFGKVVDSENDYAFVEKWGNHDDFNAHINHPFFLANAPLMAGYTVDGVLHTELVDLF